MAADATRARTARRPSIAAVKPTVGRNEPAYAAPGGNIRSAAWPAEPWFGLSYALIVDGTLLRFLYVIRWIQATGRRDKMSIIRTLALAAGSMIPMLAAQAQSLVTLHAFAGGTDGAYPTAGLLYHYGALFGTTELGGAGGQGTVFRLDLKSGRESVLHAFAPGSDGINPVGAPIFFGGLVGATSGGGGGTSCFSGGCGTIYRIDPRSGAETILYRFGGGADGGFPFASPVAAGGALYGTTGFFGGGNGTVYKLDPSSGAETVLHAFTVADGRDPQAPLIKHGSLLWGTTLEGGNDGCAQDGCGVTFTIDLASGAEQVVTIFGDTPDGASPQAGLVVHGGFLFGTTSWGGNGDFGTVFRIDLKTGHEHVLHSFSGRQDGGNPTAGLIYQGGALYGTTSLGGLYTKNCIGTEQRIGCGTLFKIDAETGALTTLYRFTGAADGAAPAAGLIYNGGVYYGTTSSGGAGFEGTVFEFMP
jgi:uncharacterized repeat protein (TIGR03803 family)